MLDVRDLVKHYRTPGGTVRAVDGITFSVARGETLGFVGESGCGKSTMARLLVRLEQASSGRVLVDGDDVTRLRGHALRRLRSQVQLVFQDPHSSLNPRLTVGSTLEEVLRVHTTGRNRSTTRARVTGLLDMVGLPAAAADRHPHQLSGGQLQRVGIARALAVEPRVLVLDEPVSALDVSVRAEIMNLLAGLREELALTYVFISHDLGIIRHISDRIAVMYLGRIVELGGWQTVSDTPLHPYAQSLQQAVPVADPTYEATHDVVPLRGEAPDAAAPPPGCPFHPRCPRAEDGCSRTEQALTETGAGHLVSCHVVAGHGPTADGTLPPD